MVTDAFDFFTGQFTRTIGDREPLFRGTVNQVGRRGEVGLYVLVLFCGAEYFRGRAITVLADQQIDLRIFAKRANPWGENHQFATIG